MQKLWAERQLFSGSFLSSSGLKRVLRKQVVLIVQKISIIINMDDIRQEKPSGDPILKLNGSLKKTSLSKKLDTHIEESIAFQVI